MIIEDQELDRCIVATWLVQWLVNVLIYAVIMCSLLILHYYELHRLYICIGFVHYLFNNQ